MKKTITIEQLEELSEKGKERLREWITTDGYFGERDDAVLCVHLDENCPANNTIGWSVDSEFNNPEWWEKAYPLLSISQMIEFLEDKSKKHKGKYFTRDDKVLSIMFAVSDLRPVKVLNWQGDLCDTLWVTVKDFLEYDDK